MAESFITAEVDYDAEGKQTGVCPAMVVRNAIYQIRTDIEVGN